MLAFPNLHMLPTTRIYRSTQIYADTYLIIIELTLHRNRKAMLQLFSRMKHVRQQQKTTFAY
jgi:hypothetical protein